LASWTLEFLFSINDSDVHFAALKIRTNTGARAFRWGGDFGDYMHWQLDCKPSDAASGVDWSTVYGGEVFDDERDEPVLKKGSKGKAVEILQDSILVYNSALLPKFGADGDYGSETVAAIRRIQGDFDLPETGSADEATLFVLSRDTGVSALAAKVNHIVSTLRKV